MVQARFPVVALAILLLLGAVGVEAQEIVLTDGSRLAGTVEKYENGFAYIRLFKEHGGTVLTTMPESAVDKAATEQAQVATTTPAVETEEAQTGPFKLPHNDLSRHGPAMAAVAAEEKERRVEAIDSGAAAGRLYKNGERVSSIPTQRQIEVLADLREQPQARPDMDPAVLVGGLRFYELRLQTLASGFARIGEAWEDMWRHCTPITYVGGREISARPPSASYREAVMKSFAHRTATNGVSDKWSISCVRQDSDFVARGRQVVEAYDLVFKAYADFAENTEQTSRVVARALPTSPH